jgi:hypothetical protein
MGRDRSGYYFRLIEKFKGSGLTLKEFCGQHSLNNKTYYYWRKKYEARGKGFLPVTIDATPKAGVGGIIIQYPDGTRVIFEGNAGTSTLKQLLPVFSK